MVVSIADHGRGIQALSNSVLDLLSQTRTTNTAINEQSKQLANLQAQVTSFQEQVFSLSEREEPQGEEGEPSPVVEATQTQTPSFFRTRGQPQMPHHQTQMEESWSSSPSLSDPEEWPSVRRRLGRESTAWPPAPQAGDPDTMRGEGRIPPPPPSVNIPKEVRVKKPEPFSGKKGREAENFIMRMEVYFNDYKPGTFSNNRKITTTLINMSPGESMNWSDPILRSISLRTAHAYTTNWNTFKEAFLLNFADPIKKEKAIRELGKLTQTKSAQLYASQFRVLAQEVSWDQTAMIDKFKEGLKPEVRMEIMKMTMLIPPTTLLAFTLEN
jgi:hypothetical protein